MTQPEPDNVPTYLVLKLVQAFERLPLLLSRQLEPKTAAVYRKIAGNESQKNLFVGVCQG